MKIRNIFLTAIALVSFHSHAFDNYFAGDGKNFIKIDLNKVNSEEYVKYSACSMNPDKLTATCKALVNVKKSEFKWFMGCQGFKQTGNALEILAGTTIGIGSLFTGGGAFIGIMIGYGVTLHGVNNADDSHDKSGIYSTKNSKDIDHISDHQDFFRFKGLLNQTLEPTSGCDVSGATLPVSIDEYIIKLTEGQKDFLKQAALEER